MNPKKRKLFVRVVAIVCASLIAGSVITTALFSILSN